MKINWNSRYNTIAAYGFIVLALSIIFYLIVSEIRLFKIQVGNYINIFQPIIIGFIMAYLFNFILEFYEKVLLNKLIKAAKKKTKRVIGIVLTYLTVLFLLYMFLYFILPQLLSSIMGLVNEIPSYFIAITTKLNELTMELYIPDEYYNILVSKWNEFVEYILNFATDLVPKIGNLTKSIVSSIWNIVLGVIVSIYLLIDKERFKALSKKLIYSIFSKKNANKIIELAKRGDHIFGRFLSGKILDSLIIGILTFVVLKVVKMPYVTLVSFIVGITNIIPFFGPFIGAIPSFFIILFVSPIKAIWFLIIILIIQQIDGNIIGPKILGDSLGISAFWILFSLLVAGKIFGFIGMVIGVPLFVFIYSIIKDIVEYRLDKKGLPKETEKYY